MSNNLNHDIMIPRLSLIAVILGILISPLIQRCNNNAAFERLIYNDKRASYSNFLYNFEETFNNYANDRIDAAHQNISKVYQQFYLIEPLMKKEIQQSIYDSIETFVTLCEDGRRQSPT